MPTTAYYNDLDPCACHVLEALIAEGHIAPGVVDCRSIAEVESDELARYTQVHLFAGFGGWALALRAAGWPDDRPVWTGSCPCQPFSSAGAGRGLADERHLWPEMFRLMREYGPSAVVGEQVASAAGLGWLDGVFADLEGAGYACGAADLCAASIGAPHIRQRLFWLADAQGRGLGGRCRTAGSNWPQAVHGGERDGRGLVNPGGTRREGHAGNGADRDQPRRLDQDAGGPAPTPGFWDRAELVRCVEPTRDGGTREVWRRAEPGVFPLADGRPGRRQALRLAGNGIVVPLAAAFVEAVMEVIE